MIRDASSVLPIAANAATSRPEPLPESRRDKVSRGIAYRSEVVSRPVSLKGFSAHQLDGARDVYLPEFFARAGGAFYTNDVTTGVWRQHYAW
ncbi:MAG: hypothetical protein ACAI38_09350 [Myxococcota bacterium]